CPSSAAPSLNVTYQSCSVRNGAGVHPHIICKGYADLPTPRTARGLQEASFMAPKQSVDDDSLAYLEACLPRKMVEAALNKLAPLKIHLAAPEENRRWIEFDPPTTVEFIKYEGIRIVTTGRFRIDIAKIEIPAQLHRIEFLVAPRIVSADKFSHAAALPIEILDADVRFIPGLIDSLIVSQVNQDLTPKASQ